MEEYNKKLLTIILSVIFICFAISFTELRTITIDYKSSDVKDINIIMNKKDNEELMSYVVIKDKPIEFASYEEDNDNIYFFCKNGDKTYVVFGNKLSISNLKEGSKITGVTTKIVKKFKDVIIEGYNDRYSDKLTLDNFNEKIGTVYLNTNAGKYDMTTKYNTLILIFVLMAIVTFIYGVIGSIICVIKNK